MVTQPPVSVTTSDTPAILAELVEQARQAADVPVKRLADDSGIPRTTLTRMLAGQRDFFPQELRALARVLGVPVSSWFRHLADVFEDAA